MRTTWMARIGRAVLAATALLAAGCMTGAEYGREGAISSAEESITRFPDATAKVTTDLQGIVTVRLFDQANVAVGELEWDVQQGAALWNAEGESAPLAADRFERLDAEMTVDEQAGVLAYEMWKGVGQEVGYMDCCYPGGPPGCITWICYFVYVREYQCWDEVVCPVGAECGVIQVCDYVYVPTWECSPAWQPCGVDI